MYRVETVTEVFEARTPIVYPKYFHVTNVTYRIFWYPCDKNVVSMLFAFLNSNLD